MFTVATANWHGKDVRFIALPANLEPEGDEPHTDLLMVFNPETMKLESNALSKGVFREYIGENNVTTEMTDAWFGLTKRTTP